MRRNSARRMDPAQMDQSCQEDPRTESEGEEPYLDGSWVAAVQRGLVAWYGEARRELPWRANRDPYRILVSELMLVQTTVAAVIPYFERFLRRFPDIQSLAEADEAQVLKAWEGLGYYRRARQLHAAARQVVQEYGGTIPDDPAAVRALPGVGRYIAGALLSMAFDRPEPIVEANSQRVLARLVAMRENLKAASARERIWQAAERLVPARGAGTFNQALMELGRPGLHAQAAELPVLPVVGALPGPPAGDPGRDPAHNPKTPSSRSHRGLRGGHSSRQGLDRAAGPGWSLGTVLGVPDHSPRGGRSRGSVLRRVG